jgi:hypothetical protein
MRRSLHGVVQLPSRIDLASETRSSSSFAAPKIG